MQASYRNMAIRAMRSECRKQGIKVKGLKPDQMLLVLDDLARREPELIVSQWYSDASENQIRLLKREWNRLRFSPVAGIPI